MQSLRTMFIVGVVAAALGSAALVFAGVPAKSATLKIDAIPGKKGAVKFAHAKHADAYKDAKGKAISCKTCHHTLKTATPAKPGAVKKCSECHVKPGVALKKVGGKDAPALAAMKGDKVDKKSVLFHTSCNKCHKAVVKVNAEAKTKKIDKCKGCH